MKARWGVVVLAWVAFAVVSFATSQVSAQTACETQCIAITGGCPGGPINCPGGSFCFGTPAADCIFGTALPDIIFSGAGNDCVCGGLGDDTINGDDGADIIFGEEGADIIDGGNDNDTISGGDDDDTINGSGGDDFLAGDLGNDSLLGGPGNDQLFGAAGDDTLEGGDDNDTLFGQAGADILRGDDGDDTLNGGTENDQLFGGNGADSLIGGAGDDALNGEGGDDPQLDGGDGEDTINGGPGNDTANGGPGIDFISGGADDDVLSGGDGPDIIDGNDGDDTLNGNADNDRLDGGAGINDVNGNSGIDVCLNFTTTDFSCDLFTHATLDSFISFVERGSVIVRWSTSSETGTVGFRVMREEAGEWVPVHEGLLPGLLDAPLGGIYDLRDDVADAKQPQRYLLVEVDLHGVEAEHGPFDVVPESEGESLLGDAASYARERHATVARGPVQKAVDTDKQSGGEPIALYFGVERTGLYAVRAAEIAAGFRADESSIRAWIQAGELLLTEGGESVAWSGADDGSELTFFGLERESLYTTERFYRLSIDSGDTMSQRSVSPSAITDGLAYSDTLHLEENLIPGILVAQDPDVDYWYWQLITATAEMQMTAETVFPLESVQGDGTLRIQLHGVIDTAHSVDVSVNGSLLGTARFSGVVPHEAVFSIPESVLVEGDNTLSVTPTETSDSMLYLDAADVAYTRGYATSATTLRFRADQAASVEIAGLSGSGLRIFDVSDPHQPVELMDAVVGGGGVQLVVEPTVEYFALTPDQLLTPASTWVDVASDLRSSDNGADYLIIAPAGLVIEAEELAAHREAEGLTSMVVELQDIFDEFAHGTPDPNAIRDFLGFAHENWTAAPAFVVLVGKGSFDYREILGPAQNLLPPIMALTHAGILSSDTKYADFLGDDGIPDTAIGRLPVTSPSELGVVTRQIIDYEDSFDSIGNGIALFADAAGPQGDFGAAQDEIAAQLPGVWETTRIYRSEFEDVEMTRAAFFDAVRDSPRVVSYLGHSGTTALGKKETLLEVADVETMEVDETQPIFATMTCSASRFAVPGGLSLGEALFLDEEAAVAVWGPSGISINEQATLLSRAFLTELNAGAETRIGPMINRAYAVLADLELGRDMVEIYHLFGDPALRVAKGSDPPSGTGGIGGDGGAGGTGSGVTSPPTGELTLASCSVGWSKSNTGGAAMLLIGLALVIRRRRHWR